MDSLDSVEIIPDSEDPSVISETPTTTNASHIEDGSIQLESETSSAKVGEEEESDKIVEETVVDNSYSEDMFKSIEATSSEVLETIENSAEDVGQKELDSMDMDREVEIIDDEREPEDVDEIAEEEGEADESEEVMEDGNDEDTDDEDENLLSTQLPFGRIQKIMKICVKTVEEEDTPEEPEVQNTVKHKGKGKARATKKIKNSNTANMLVMKEAVFLTTVATELFIAAVTQQSSKITAATKKKTVALDHLKRAMSDSECYEFLQGCFQPSIIIGD